MTTQPASARPFDIARRDSGRAKFVHCLYPAWEANEFTSVSDTSSIGVAFTWQPYAVIERPGAIARQCEIPLNSIGLCGTEPITWLAVGRPSEQVEISLKPELRRAVADELGAITHRDLDELFGWHDPVILAIAQRVRAGLRGWSHVSSLEYETLARAAYGHVLIRRFGARRPRLRGGLDQRRLAKVLEFVQDDPGAEHGIEQLATIAALSPFHFTRAFRQATGLTPHRFVTLTRIDTAIDLLRKGDISVEQAAAATGFNSLRHFRRLMREQCGVTPSALRTGKTART